MKNLWIILAFIGSLSIPYAAESASLLTGCVPGSCSAPSGWTIVTTQNFETGSLPSNQSKSGSFCSDRAHTGTFSVCGTIAGDAQDVRWTLAEGVATGLHTYVSVWEFRQSNSRFNDENFLFHFFKTGSPNSDIVIDWYSNGLGPGGNGQFNSTSAHLNAVTEGATNVNRRIASNYEVPVGAWHQWEIDYQGNSVGSSNGNISVWLDGALVGTLSNIAFFVSDMSNPRVQVGGTYTKHIWFTGAAGDPAVANSYTCSSGTGVGNGLNAHRWQDFAVDMCNHATSAKDGLGNVLEAPPPIWSRYYDDIIVMIAGGGGGPPPPPPDNTPPGAPTGIEVTQFTTE